MRTHAAGGEPVVGGRPDDGTLRRRSQVYQQRRKSYVRLDASVHENVEMWRFCQVQEIK